MQRVEYPKHWAHHFYLKEAAKRGTAPGVRWDLKTDYESDRCLEWIPHKQKKRSLRQSTRESSGMFQVRWRKG